MKSYVTRMEIYDDIGDLAAVVESVDVCAGVEFPCAGVEFPKQSVNTPETWDELSAAIRAAIKQITEAA
jgi:hypothetical protein